MKKMALFSLIGLCLLALPLRAQINLLHEFAGTTTDGAYPRGDLLLSGTTFFGMTTHGGNNDKGTIFKVQTDGSVYTLLHEFAGGDGDGSEPSSSLILSGTTLYGMTERGGVNDDGIVFKIETNGSDFTMLHEFTGDDGRAPVGSPILFDSTLYGMTGAGGYSDRGTIFKIQTDGTGFSILREFAFGADDGSNPYGSLLISDSTLYGMTYFGGGSDWGTIFKIQTDGTGFNLLHEFASGDNDGSSPCGSLIIVDSTLYGMTRMGGNSNSGTIFKIQTDGTGYTLLHEFSFSPEDGEHPEGSLILSGSTLYGMTNYGGDSLGTIFKIKTNGTLFSLLHKFPGGADNGAIPDGSLILSGSTLYGMTEYGGENDFGVVFSLSLPFADGITIASPNGGEIWAVGTSQHITWVSTGSIANVNIDYSTDSGSNWIPIVDGTTNDGSYAWIVPDRPSTNCLIRIIDASNSVAYDVSDSVFSISSITTESISTPTTPSGPTTGTIGTSYDFTTGGSTSSLGHAVQYKFDWNDGSDSGWLSEGTTQAMHSWSANRAFSVRALARCISDTGIESLWSDTHAITISDNGTLGKYNSPSQQKILPEMIWAAATGGGTWMSEVQVTDLSGGSQVSVYYNTASGRRGPFLLWDNSAGAALSSVKYDNLLETIDGLDSGAFSYYGTVGAVEFITQDNSHVLQAAARTLNGNYSKTFQALSLHDSNTADTSRVMVIPNLTNNSVYRSTCGMFNPTTAALTIELRLVDAMNNQIGSTFNKTLNGYGFTAFSPFNEAGVAYPANSYDNIILKIQPTSGTGKALCFGASANNVTNDPAAHVAVQKSSNYDNGPGAQQILPEAIWAPASGGGTWMSEAQIVDVSGGSTVSVYFDYGGGSRRGPFTLWTGSGAGSKVKYANILQQLEMIDSGFTYSGRVGTVEFKTQDNAHTIQVMARTLNGNVSKTFPGLNLVDAETADTSRVMIIQNYTNSVTYRSTCGFYNPTADAVTVEFTLLWWDGAPIGTPFSKTFVGYDFQAFNPFNEADVPYPANSYDNVILRVRPTSGTGQVICFGASANNASNDPAAHLAVQGQ